MDAPRVLPNFRHGSPRCVPVLMRLSLPKDLWRCGGVSGRNSRCPSWSGQCLPGRVQRSAEDLGGFLHRALLNIEFPDRVASTVPQRRSDVIWYVMYPNIVK